jgi:large subunit ribosomal protein L15
MNLSNLKPAEGSTHNSKRLGRGQGSGKGGTSTKGHKGHKSRSGYSRKKGFEGGQMPMQRRLPKFGFNNINRVEYKVINLQDLQTLAEKRGIDNINIQILIENGLASRNSLIKVLGNGKLNMKLEVSAHAFSKAAISAIESQGGVVVKL